MKARITIVLALVLCVGLLYGLRAAIRAHRDLVTLKVRNMEIRKVVKKIEWQTWESISVDKGVQGKVTLNVRNVPLEEVLKIVCAQTSSRWSTLYPLYSNGKSLAWLKRGLRGEIDPALHGWTNWQNRAGFAGGPMFGGGGPMGNPGMPTNRLISLEFSRNDVEFANLALARFAQLRVVPEDGTAAMVSLKLRQATVSQAVAGLAKKARRNWTRLYALRSDFGPGGPGGPGGPRQFASRDANGPGGLPPSTGDNPNGPGRRGPGMMSNLTPEEREELQKKREALENNLKQTLPSAQREQLEQAQKEREQQFQEMQSLTPEQRRERMAQARGGPGAGIDRMNRERIKNSTPEQRVEMQRRMIQMRQRMEQAQPTPGTQPSPRT